MDVDVPASVAQACGLDFHDNRSPTEDQTSGPPQDYPSQPCNWERNSDRGEEREGGRDG